jgi:ABC-type antimicrobial peptide transport system permease subunit
MIWSYLKIALRNLLRSKLYAFINITGLSVAIALCVVAYVNYQFSESFDSFHENGDQIYRIKSKVQEKNRVRNWAYVPRPISDVAAKEVPGIIRSTRFRFDSGVLRYGDKVFNESLSYADENFFQMFSFPFVSGNENALQEKNTMVISRTIAKKYFGDENPIDKRMVLSFDGEESFGVVVGAVIEDIPLNSSFQFDILLPYSRAKDLRELDLEDWGSWTAAALIQVDDQADIAGIERQLQSYVQRQNEANEEYKVREFYLDPLKNLAKTSDALIGDNLQNGLPVPAIVGPSVAALLVLLMACFNFVNTALAYSSRRLKEIGIRKVVGSVRKQLIAQFLGENLVLCFFALLAGIGLSEIFVPIYDGLWPKISLSIDLTENLGRSVSW